MIILPKRVLVACEESQAVCIELRKMGFEAYSCDIIDCSGGHPEWHLKQDVLPLLNEHWDMIIAFPPCTYLSNAGACRLYPHKGQVDMERYKKGLGGKEFFMHFYNANCEHIAIENPIPSTIYHPIRRLFSHTSSGIHTARKLVYGLKAYQNLNLLT